MGAVEQAIARERPIVFTSDDPIGGAVLKHSDVDEATTELALRRFKTVYADFARRRRFQARSGDCRGA